MNFVKRSLLKHKENEYVKIIKCKDCVHYINTSLGWCDYHSHFTNMFMEEWTIFNEEDYCSWAEHK